MSNHESKHNNPRISSQITISSVFPVTSKSLRSQLSAAPHLLPWPGAPQRPEQSQGPAACTAPGTLRAMGSSFASPRHCSSALETLPEFRPSTSYWCSNFQVLVMFNSDLLWSFFSLRSDRQGQQRAVTCFSNNLFNFCLPFAHIIAHESSCVLQGVSSLLMAARTGMLEDREGGEAGATAPITCNIW